MSIIYRTRTKKKKEKKNRKKLIQKKQRFFFFYKNNKTTSTKIHDGQIHNGQFKKFPCCKGRQSLKQSKMTKKTKKLNTCQQNNYEQFNNLASTLFYYFVEVRVYVCKNHFKRIYISWIQNHLEI